MRKYFSRLSIVVGVLAMVPVAVAAVPPIKIHQKPAAAPLKPIFEQKLPIGSDKILGIGDAALTELDVVKMHDQERVIDAQLALVKKENELVKEENKLRKEQNPQSSSSSSMVQPGPVTEVMSIDGTANGKQNATLLLPDGAIVSATVGQYVPGLGSVLSMGFRGVTVAKGKHIEQLPFLSPNFSGTTPSSSSIPVPTPPPAIPVISAH